MLFEKCFLSKSTTPLGYHAVIARIGLRELARLEPLDRDYIVASIIKAIPENIDLTFRLVESIERHYIVTLTPITHMELVYRDNSWAVFKWKEDLTTACGVFELTQGLELLSCLIIQCVYAEKLSETSMKWVVKRIDDLKNLLQIAQSTLGPWCTKFDRLVFTEPVGNIEAASTNE